MDADLYKAAIEGDISGIEKLSEKMKIHQVTEEDGSTILHLASRMGKTECVRFILTQFANEPLLIAMDRKGRMALHYAAERGHTDAVELLMNATRGLLPSMFIRHPDLDGKTALHAAIGSPNTVELLIIAARGFLPSSEFEEFITHADLDGDTALHLAVRNNNVETVKLLVKADPNHKHSLNKMSKSPLYIAVEQGFKDILKVILESCTSPTFDGPDGQTALHAAIRSPDTEERLIDAVELLINGARGFLPSSKFENFIRHADLYGNTALHRAVYNNQVEVVKLLVKADPNHKHSVNHRSESPLYIAVKQGYGDIVIVILESCTSPTFDGRDGQTALHAAIESPDTDAVELLINGARGFLPSSKFENFIRHADLYGNIALHRAVYNNQVEVVKLLTKADPNHKYSVNSDDKSPLYIAVEQGFNDIVEVICKSCTTPNFDAPNGKTVLHAAIGSPNTVELLINAARGFLPSSEFENFIRHADVDGDTALHLAVRNNNVETLKLLGKADPNHKHSLNKMSKSPLYIAVEQGFKDIVKVICESCATPSFDGPHGKTALHAAIENRDTDSVGVILDKRGDLVLKRDDRGWTAADCAASKNFLSILDILIKTENNQFHHDYSEYKQFFMDRPHKETAIHRAAFEGRIFTVLQLMKLYPDFIWCAVNKDGQTILHIAVDQNYKELVQAILQYCPDLSLILNTKDEKGNTPLHLLVMRGLFILELIRNERVDRNAKNKENFTPYELLYRDEEIIADQLKIKEALEDSEFINQRWNFGLRKNKQELVSAESPVVPSTRYTKDAKFEKARDLLIKEEIKLYRARINTQIIVTALITTVTFTVGFTMPGGYHQRGEEDEGSALLSKKVAFNVFVLADTVALLLSMSSLALYFIASMYQDAEVIAKLVDASTVLNIISVVATMLTFVMGICLVLPHSSALLISVGVMSAFFILLIVLLLIVLVKDPVEKFRK